MKKQLSLRFITKLILILFILFFALTTLISYLILPTLNPGPSAPLPAWISAESAAILKESCYDCHSYEVKTYWYKYLPGPNVVISKHIQEGREYLNFSTWPSISSLEIAEEFEESLEEINKGSMALPEYVFIHPEAEINFDEYMILLTDFENWQENVDLDQNHNETIDNDYDDHDDHDHT